MISEEKSKHNSTFRLNMFKDGLLLMSKLLAYVFGVLILVGGCNFISDFLSLKFNSKIDLSLNKNFSFSDNFKKYLQNFNKKITIYLPPKRYLSGVTCTDSQLRLTEFYRNMYSLNSNFKIEEIDDRFFFRFISENSEVGTSIDFGDDEAKEQEYKKFFEEHKHLLNYSYVDLHKSQYDQSQSDLVPLGKAHIRTMSVNLSNIFLVSDDEKKITSVRLCDQNNYGESSYLPSDSFINTEKTYNLYRKKDEMDRYEFNYDCFEKLFVIALEQLYGNENLIRVAYPINHSEQDFSLSDMFFKSIGVNLEKINLKVNNILKEQKVVFIAAPMVDFSKEEIEKLEIFLNEGGSIIYCASASQGKLTFLEEFLKKYGIVVQEGMVREANLIENTHLVVCESNKFDLNHSNKILKPVEKLPLIFDECKPIKIETPQNGYQITELCKTLPSGVISNAKVEDNLNDLPQSQLPVVVCSTKNFDGKTSNLVAISSVDFMKGDEIDKLLTDKQLNFKYKDNTIVRNVGSLVGNNQFFSCLFKDMVKEDKLPYFPIQITKVVSIPFKRDFSNFLMYLHFIILPLSFILCGIITIIFTRIAGAVKN